MGRFSNWLVYQMIAWDADWFTIKLFDPFWWWLRRNRLVHPMLLGLMYHDIRFHWFLDYQARHHGREMRYIEYWKNYLDV